MEALYKKVGSTTKLPGMVSALGKHLFTGNGGFVQEQVGDDRV